MEGITAFCHYQVMAKPEKYRFSNKQSVAWGDMDAYGHLNNVIYARYFETARALYFTNAGLWEDPSRVGQGAPVLIRLEIDFRRQVVFPATLDVTIDLDSVNSRGFGMPCSMWQDEDCVATAYASFVWFDFKKGRPERMPENLLQSLREKQMPGVKKTRAENP